MIAALSQRERRLLAIAILLALIALVWLALIAPLIDGFAERAERRDLLGAAYQRNDRLISSLPRLRRNAERQRTARTEFALPAANAAQASDLLKERLSIQFEEAGGQVLTVEEVPTRPGWAQARLQGSATLDQIIPLLGRLQNEPPYLVIESLSIVADKAAQSGHLDRMDIKVEASSPFGAANAR